MYAHVSWIPSLPLPSPQYANHDLNTCTILSYYLLALLFFARIRRLSCLTDVPACRIRPPDVQQEKTRKYKEGQSCVGFFTKILTCLVEWKIRGRKISIYSKKFIWFAGKSWKCGECLWQLCQRKLTWIWTKRLCAHEFWWTLSGKRRLVENCRHMSSKTREKKSSSQIFHDSPTCRTKTKMNSQEKQQSCVFAFHIPIYRDHSIIFLQFLVISLFFHAHVPLLIIYSGGNGRLFFSHPSLWRKWRPWDRFPFPPCFSPFSSA